MLESFHIPGFVWLIITGGIAGWLASLLVKGEGMGLLADVVVGILGAVVGGLLADHFHIYVHGFWGVLGMSVLGAVILLVLARALSPSKKRD